MKNKSSLFVILSRILLRLTVRTRNTWRLFVKTSICINVHSPLITLNTETSLPFETSPLLSNQIFPLVEQVQWANGVIGDTRPRNLGLEVARSWPSHRPWRLRRCSLTCRPKTRPSTCTRATWSSFETTTCRSCWAGAAERGPSSVSPAFFWSSLFIS